MLINTLELIKDLGPGDLLLLDRGYPGFVKILIACHILSLRGFLLRRQSCANPAQRV